MDSNTDTLLVILITILSILSMVALVAVIAVAVMANRFVKKANEIADVSKENLQLAKQQLSKTMGGLALLRFVFKKVKH